jgi:hypothetical protein
VPVRLSNINMKFTMLAAVVGCAVAQKEEPFELSGELRV